LVREYRQYIGGEWVGSEQLSDDLDPYRGTVMARIPAGTRADAARAADAAAAAFPAWAELPPAEKQALFLRAADVVERRRGDIVALLAEETGCAGGFAGFQVLTATRLLRQAANGTVIGPLINAAALHRVSGEVRDAVDAGATLLAGGDAEGPCYRPTILADVPAGARIHSEETFGPVLVAQPVDDADEAVAIANSTSYGLSAGLITGDNQRGFALARRIDSGVVHVNDQTVADEPQLPLGGMKDSGWGRSGPASMHDFTEIQWITTREGTGRFPI
jgi:acyl-CoA reductase-like NAD-dependent aldehyde dehydrogenase